MDTPSQDEIRTVARTAGFELDVVECSDLELRTAIREIETLAAGANLSDLQCRALRQTLPMVILRTALSSKAPGSLPPQSRLRRWEFLRQASEQGVAAYVAVLRLFGIEPPSCLMEGPE